MDIVSLCTTFGVPLYNADSQLSSPIHKTEAHFSAEQTEVENEVPQQTHLKMKSGARLARLAVLADTIKNWEDDLSHPTAVSSHYVCSSKVCKGEIY
jgi:hypothetical protein